MCVTQEENGGRSRSLENFLQKEKKYGICLCLYHPPNPPFLPTEEWKDWAGERLLMTSARNRCRCSRDGGGQEKQWITLIKLIPLYVTMTLSQSQFFFYFISDNMTLYLKICYFISHIFDFPYLCLCISQYDYFKNDLAVTLHITVSLYFKMYSNKQTKITLFLIVDFSLYVSVSIATASSDNKIMTSYLTIATSRQNCKFFISKLWLSHNVSLYLSLRLYFISHFHISQCYYI